MPKESYNSKISHPNVYGRIIQHDVWLSQSVTNTGQPTFSALSITGDATIGGNLYVLGNSSVFNTDIIEFEDNILLVNKAETGAGVTLNQAGIEIERGSAENARIVFNEPDDTIRIGLVNSLQAVATREDAPLSAGVMVWNDSLKRLDSTNTVTIPITFSSTSNSAVQVSGAIKLLGQTVDASLDMNTTDTLVISAPNDISIIPSRNVVFPMDRRIAFGTVSNTVQNLYVNSTNSNFVIESTGDVDLKLQSGKSLKIPQLTRLALSSSIDNYIGNDSNDDTVIGSTQSVRITPTRGSRVVFPNSISVTYGDNTNTITGFTTGDLSLSSGRNIDLTPGSDGEVKIPTGYNLRFGTTGSQSIVSDTSNNLIVSSTNDLFLKPSGRIGITAGTLLLFDNTNVSLSGSLGELRIVATRASISGTENASGTNTNGSFRIEGGVSVAKRVYSTEALEVNSTSSTSLLIRNSINNILSVSSSNTVGSINVSAGNGATQAAMVITSNDQSLADNLVQFKTNTDSTNGYSIGRESRNLKLNIPTHADYSSTGATPELDVFSGPTKVVSVSSFGITKLMSTENSTFSTDGSLVVEGGVGVKKDIVTSGRFEQSVDSTSATLIKSANNSEMARLDSINKAFHSAVRLDVSDSTESTNTQAGSIVTKGGAVIEKKLRVLGETNLYENLVMNSKLIQSVADPVSPQDAATKNYVDLYIQGISVKQSVTVATTTAQTLATDFFVGSVIDSYTLLLGDRVLIKNQASSIQNGLYNVTGVATPPTRTLDYTAGDRASGTFVFVREGAINKNMGFVCNSPQATDVIGTDPLTYTQFTGLGQVDPGAALSSNANQLNVNVDNSSIEVFSDSLRIKSGAVGTGMTGGSGTVLETTPDQSHVTKLGTITVGTWTANTIGTLYGGTGNDRFTSGNILFGNESAPVKTSSKLYFNSTSGNLAIGDGISTTPQSTVTITNTSMANILLHADSAEANSAVYPEILLRHGQSGKQGALKIARSADSFATGIFQDSTVLGASDALQVITNSTVRATFTSIGNVGINNTSPTTTLDITGSFKTTGLNTLLSQTNSTTSSDGALVISGGVGITKSTNIGATLGVFSTSPSTNSTSGAIVIYNGGVSIGGTTNASSSTSGGALTVAGGGAFEKDLQVGGKVVSNSVENATNTTSGGLTTLGGISAEKDLYIGGNITLDNTLDLTSGVSIKSTNATLVMTVDNEPVVMLTSRGNMSITGQIKINDSAAASEVTNGSLVVIGGANIRSNAIISRDLHVKSTNVSTNCSSGGIIVSGGIGIAGSANIGIDLKVDGVSRHSYNAALTSINNTNVSTSAWFYLGNVTRANVTLENLDFIMNNSTSVSHSFIGSTPESNLVVYEGLASDYHLFALVQPSSRPNLQVHSSDQVLVPIYEGVSATPNGTVSGYTGGWTSVYTSLSTNASITTNIGSLVCGDVKSRDNLPLFAYDYTQSPARSLGTVSQLTLDEITGFNTALTDTVPSQSGATLYQVKLSTSANASNDTYNGWFVKVTSGLSSGQTRQVKDYTGAVRTIELETPWDTQGPEEDDTIELFNKSTVAVHYTSGSFVTSFNTIDTTTKLVQQELTNLQTNNVSCGNVSGISVSLTSSTVSSSTSGSIFTQGGITAKKGMYLENGKLKIGGNLAPTSTTDTTTIHLFEDASSIRLQSTTGSYSYMDFEEDGNSNKFGLLHSSNNLFLTTSNNGATPNNDTDSTKGLTLTSSGRIGINCTTNIDSPLTITSSLITTDTNTNYLGISGGRTSTSGGNIVLYGNSHASSAGSILVSATRTKMIGEVVMNNTTQSINSTTGALIALGGISISNTNNATSITGGGALTVGGGVAIKQDLYVGGSIVTGSLTVIGLNSSPSISFSNTSNCTVSAFGNASLSLVGTEGILSFYVTILPTTAHLNTEFQFDIPSRTSVLPARGDIISACSGWTDDTDLIVLQNILCVGVAGTTRALVKFQSASTSAHVIQIISRYTPV